jgi:hypothetical protein
MKYNVLYCNTENYNIKELDDVKAPRLTLIINALENCGIFRPKLYEFYGKMSQAIHGQPWNGPSLRVRSDLLEETEYCFIKKLAEATSLTVD